MLVCKCEPRGTTCHLEIEKVVVEVECGAAGVGPGARYAHQRAWLPRSAAPAAAPARSPSSIFTPPVHA
eukprot:2935120-Prymnesium_polylepis.1